MADSTSPTESMDPSSQQPDPDNPNHQSNEPDPPPSSSSSTPPNSVPPNPNYSTPPPPSLIVSPPQPPSINPYSAVPAAPPVPVPSAPQYSPLPNPNLMAPPNYQNPGVQPPGVSAVPVVSSVPPIMPLYASPGQPPNPAFRLYAPPMPNGYPAMSQPAYQGSIPAGILRYPSPYMPMVRPAFPPRPPVGFIPALSRPLVPAIRGPIISPIVRPAITPSVTPIEKPQTTVYVGKISTVENEFMLSLLQLCGPVKSWKRAQDPTTGTLKGFGFCEFESPEGVLRALRLLSKLNIDGQELMLNVDQATREYLGHYVQKKTENSKNLKTTKTEGAEKEEGSASDTEKNEPLKPPVEPPKPIVEDSKKDDDDTADKENHDSISFGLVTEEDREADREALEKLTGMIEERLKTKPLPPPPPPLPQTTADGSGNSNLQFPSKSRDGDSDVDIMKNDAAEDTKDDEMTSESKHPSEHDRPEISSDRGRRNDRRSKDRERDLKRDKERELERYERDREQERAKREREREYKIREDERRYKVRVKDWESREREKEHQRKMEKEREKEREQEREWEIVDQERESDDGYSKRRKYRSSGEDRKRRQREKEEDLADRLKEEEEIAEAKRRAEEEHQRQKQQEKDAFKLLPCDATNGSDKAILPDETNIESKDKSVDYTSDGDAGFENNVGNGIVQNGIGDESYMESISTSDLQQGSNAPARKLGFGLAGSGKRTAVPSVFHEEDEDARKEKKMRPLVPIDYSVEEVHAAQATVSGAPSSNLAAAAEFAKRISNVTTKEERPDAEKERSRRPHDRSSHRNRDRNDEETHRRDESRKETDRHRDRSRERGSDKLKTTDNQKLLDAKELIDMIPKTKDELFSYEINWAIYDKNGLHERMRPWLSKKITEYLGEEEPTLVDFVVSSIGDHVKGSEMLERLQAILDEEAEMFVLKLWRMLIFEIKKVESGLVLRSKS